MDYSRQYYDAINLVHFHFPTNWTPKFSRSYSEFFLRINNNAREKPIHTLISNLFHFFSTSTMNYLLILFFLRIEKIIWYKFQSWPLSCPFVTHCKFTEKKFPTSVIKFLFEKQSFNIAP